MLRMALILGLLNAPQDALDRLDDVLENSGDRTRRGVVDALRREFGPPSFLTEVDFDLASSKPFIPVRVNGRGPFTFILDTGSAGGWVIERKRAKALGLAIRGERNVHAGAGEGQRVLRGSTKGVTFRFGSVERPGSSSSTLEMEHVEPYEGRNVDGLLGRTFLDRHVVVIDYAGRKVRVHDPDSYAYRGEGTRLPIEFLGGLMTVKATVVLGGDRPVGARLVVDTGARTALLLNRPFAEEHVLRKPRGFRFRREATIGGGIGGESRGRVGRLTRLVLGDLALERPVTICSTDRTGVLASPTFSGILGGPLLRKFTVIVDYPRRTLILEPNDAFRAPTEYDMSGLFFTAIPPDFARFRVKSVMEGSPASKAGVRRDDIIISVDGRPSGRYTLDSLRRLLRTPGRKVQLELLRGDRRIPALLGLQRLI